MFEWHFTIRGPPDTPFEGGQYHGRILLPADYPFKPPNIVFLTVYIQCRCSLKSVMITITSNLKKNGRFEVGTKICLSISAYHEESWQPAWGGNCTNNNNLYSLLVLRIRIAFNQVRTMLEAIISFLPSEGAGAIGALDWTAEERKTLAVEVH